MGPRGEDAGCGWSFFWTTDMQKKGRGQSRAVDVGRYIRAAAREEGVVMSGRAVSAVQDILHAVAGNTAGKIAAISASKKPMKRKWGRLALSVLKPRTVGAAVLLALGSGDFAADASMHGRDSVARYEASRLLIKAKEAVTQKNAPLCGVV